MVVRSFGGALADPWGYGDVPNHQRRLQMSWRFRVAALVGVISVTCVGLVWAEEKNPKYTIKEVMKDAHKSGLYKKVAEGKADKSTFAKIRQLFAKIA
jgi:hypothetical protein